VQKTFPIENFAEALKYWKESIAGNGKVLITFN
jgi:hypothetical protein